MPKDSPKISIWVTSTGRFDEVVPTIETFINQCTYSNYEFIIIESQMTPDSLKFFDISRINAEKTEKYLQELPNKYPDVKFKIFVQPWKKLGAVYNQLLAHTEGYFVNLEDDAITVADPAPQFVDSVRMFQDDPKLLGLRIDLRDDTVFEGSSRFQGTKEAAGIKFVYWDWCSGGAQLMDAGKVRNIGGYYEDHPVDKYGETEIDQTTKMRSAGMYIGVSLKYYGFWVHISETSVQGADRKWSCQLYEKLAKKGWCGYGKNKEQL
ncbi:hypothetical protein LCGC14_1707460 [marine sediment metagenome]|uniref:Glycosyltransferase 2-like domain-containing protein n=1 Tax=marine sediment metagenome TaxID=412755 RepID=A0A0F9HGM4_9ZZZZ